MYVHSVSRTTAGPINYVDVLKNSDGRSRGCAAVVFETENAAEKAIRESRIHISTRESNVVAVSYAGLYDQSELDGRRISILFDRSN